MLFAGPSSSESLAFVSRIVIGRGLVIRSVRNQRHVAVPGETRPGRAVFPAVIRKFRYPCFVPHGPGKVVWHRWSA